MFSWLYNSPIYSTPLGPAPTEQCWNFAPGERFSSVKSLLRLGPDDTSTSSIVFWSGAGTNYTIITKIAEANINVVMTFNSVVITYGSTSWTLFEDLDFEGNFVCMDTPDVIRYTWPVDLNLTTVRSVIKGCNFSREYINQVRQTLR